MNRYFYDEIIQICQSLNIHYIKNYFGEDTSVSIASPCLQSPEYVRVKIYSNGETGILSKDGDRLYSLKEYADLGCPVCKEYIARRVFKNFSNLAE